MANSTSSSDADLTDNIAVVGLSLRFPGGANTLDSFWQLLVQGRCIAQELPVDRLGVNGIHWPKESGPIRRGHFLDGDIAAFDAPFFSITAAEASSMDPQQRLLMEASYTALENAGLPMGQISGSKTSVYIGCFNYDYDGLYKKDMRDSAPYAASGVTGTLNANRISWFYNLTGSSVNVDTACSSSLVALDMACRELRGGQAEMSLVGGSNLMLTPDMFQLLAGMNMLSASGRSHSFDARASGYGRGEGVAILVLKRLDRALHDGDTIRAVIRSTACNQNGYVAGQGITRPSKAAQIALIDECYAQAGLDKARTAYVEAHGTGTPAGDPVEAEALGASFAKNRNFGDRLYVGSVKANIGHLEGASGIVSIIKAVAMLERGVIPPLAGLETVNPSIDEADLGIKFPRSVTPWPRYGLRRISVNSFGFGGSNAHAVLDDAYHFLLEHGLAGVVYAGILGEMRSHGPSIPVSMLGQQPNSPVNGSHGLAFSQYRVLLISAADKAGVDRTSRAYSEYFARARPNGGTFTAIPSFLDALLTFVFTGQGSQWPGMGKELQQFPAFRRHIEEADIYLQSLGCEWQLKEELEKQEAASRIHEPQISQVLCTVLQTALVDLLADFNIRPHYVIGHSSGEIAAAYCCTAISARSAWRIAYYRGIHASSLRNMTVVPGAMMAVGLGPDEIAPYLTSHHTLSIACYNSPRSVTLTGDEPAIDSLKTSLDNAGLFARKLRTGVAYHSTQMLPIADPYAADIGTPDPGIVSHTSSTSQQPTMISTVTGLPVSFKIVQQALYWTENLVSPVHFTQAFKTLCSGAKEASDPDLNQCHYSIANPNIFLEIGPHGTLRGPVQDILAAHSLSKTTTYLSTLQREHSGVATLLDAVGHMWCLGLSPDMAHVNMNCAKKGQQVKDMIPLTDLPGYPWDHSRRYWHESRISKGYRLRDKSVVDILGEAEVDWNPLQARWRNFITLHEYPWITDHKVNGTILFPAAGIITMAIEAIRQLHGDPEGDACKPIAGYELRDIILRTALVIPNDERGVETHFFLHQPQPSTSAGTGGGHEHEHMDWSSFRLCAYVGTNWREICSGQIRVGYLHVPSKSSAEVDGARVNQQHVDDLQSMYSKVQETQGTDIDSSTFYARLKDAGLDFGPSFRLAGKMRCLGRESTAEVRINARGYVVHPCTLDAVLHVSMIPMMADGVRRNATPIPSNIRRVWIAENGLEPSEALGQALHVTSIVNSETFQLADVQSRALIEDGTRVSVELDGIQLTMTELDVVDSIESPATEQLWNLIWRPDIDLMSVEDINHWCTDLFEPVDEPIEYYQQLAFLHYAHLKQATVAASNGTITPQALHLQQYLMWAQHHVNDLESGAMGTVHWDLSWESLVNNPAHLLEIENWLENVNSEGKAHVAVARHLQQILRSEIDPRGLLFGSSPSLPGDMYTELCSSAHRSFQALERYLGLYAHKYSNATYLEIGAGTGVTTAAVLRSLNGGGDGSSYSYGTYTYTDISESFFAPARAKFSTLHNVDFQCLDIDQPFSNQGFAAESVDVVIAANVLHATKDLARTLANILILLRPGGMLILQEIVEREMGRTAFIMGLLPEWWRGTQSHRCRGPCVQSEAWHTLLLDAGFTGIEHQFRDYVDDGCHEYSVLVSRKKASADSQIPNSIHSVNIFSCFDPDKTPQYSKALQRSLNAAGLESQIVDFRHIRNMHVEPDVLAILVVDVELQGPYISGPDDQALQNVQCLLQQYKNVVWLTRSASYGTSGPEYGLISGILRVCQTELGPEGLKVMRVGLEPALEPRAYEAQALVRAMQQMMMAETPDSHEMEIEQQGGLFCIPRLQRDVVCQGGIAQILSGKVECDLEWIDAPPLKLQAAMPGIGRKDNQRFYFVDDDTHGKDLADDEVEIEVRAFGVQADYCLFAFGQNPSASEHGFFSCAGVVVRAGSVCQHKFHMGERVGMFFNDSFRKYARGKAQLTCRLPGDMGFVEAAAMMMPFVATWESIVNISRLGAGDTILIHAAAEVTGQAAIQISQQLGAEILVTVASEEEKEIIMAEYQIPDRRIFSCKNASFAMGIKHITHGRGVDVVLNSLDGDMLFASWDCLAPYGRLVGIGKKDILASKTKGFYLLLDSFTRGATFSAFDVSLWMIERANQVEQTLGTVMSLFDKESFHPSRPLRVIPISDICEALSALTAGEVSGSVVVEVDSAAIVPAIITSSAPYSFHANATYVIAGGFGGIGRCIALWMAERGARNLLLLSRSGPRSPAAHKLMDDLRAMHVHFQAAICDIADIDALRRVLAECTGNMPPIRGCIQATMSLQDTRFTRMTQAQWTAATSPKIAGSWNLHTLLPSGSCPSPGSPQRTGMDFFILLSSVSGIIGQHGQANYAAGNTFQDSLARYRVSRGETAMSIDLGVLVDDGFVAEDPALRERLLRNGAMRPITRDRFLALLEYCCDPALQRQLGRPGGWQESIRTCQVIMGIGDNTPSIGAASHESREMLDELEPSWVRRPLFRQVHRLSGPGVEAGGPGEGHGDTSSSSGRSRDRDFSNEFTRAPSRDSAAEVVVAALATKLRASATALTGLDDEENIEVSRSVASYGVDSLMAVTLRAWLKRMFQADVSTFEILGGGSLRALGGVIAGKSVLRADGRDGAGARC